MRMRALRRLTVLATVAALSVPLGLASAGAAGQQSAHTTRTAAAAEPLPGAYISPWGDAHVAMSDDMLAWMEREGTTLSAVSPFVMDADDRGFSMLIGTTAGDGLDTKGRIFYPGGIEFHHAASGKTITLTPSYIRVMPTPGYAAAVAVDGQAHSEEIMIADSVYTEAMTGARPSPTGFRVKNVRGYVSQDLADLFTSVTGATPPRVGSLWGTLTPNFDYIPGTAKPPTFPTFP